MVAIEPAALEVVDTFLVVVVLAEVTEVVEEDLGLVAATGVDEGFLVVVEDEEGFLVVVEEEDDFLVVVVGVTFLAAVRTAAEVFFVVVEETFLVEVEEGFFVVVVFLEVACDLLCRDAGLCSELGCAMLCLECACLILLTTDELYAEALEATAELEGAAAEVDGAASEVEEAASEVLAT